MDVEIELADGGDLAAHPMPDGRPTGAHRASVIHYPIGGAGSPVGQLAYEPARSAWRATAGEQLRDDDGVRYFADPEQALAAIAAHLGMGVAEPAGLTVQAVDGRVIFCDGDEEIDSEPANTLAQADAVIARYGYRRTGDWQGIGQVLAAPIVPLACERCGQREVADLDAGLCTACR